MLTLGSGPSGFPRKLSGRRPKLPRQPWVSNPRRRSRALRDCGAGGWPVGLPEIIFGATAEASATAMANPRRRSRALRYFGARRASRHNFPGEGQSVCDSLPRARFRRFSAGEWPDGLPETQRPSRAIFIKGWQSDRPFYQGRPAAVRVLSKAIAVLSRPVSLNSSFSNSGRFIKAKPMATMAVLSPRSGHMARSLDFGILPRTSSLSTAKASHF